MMAHRLIVRATNHARQPRLEKRRAPFPNVTVLLGDPSLPDSVKRQGQFNPEDLETIERLRSALGQLTEYRFEYLDRHDGLIERIRSTRPEFVLNLCDEGLENEALKELHVPALLETFKIPYSGAGPTALGVCYDKAMVNAIARSLDVPVPGETCFDPGDRGATIPSVFPALVKPSCGDSSIGITQHAVVHNAEELVDRLAALREQLPGVPILVQEFLPGTEYTVGVIGNPGLSHEVLPILEVDYTGLPAGLAPILSYESKWEPESPYWNEIRYVESRVATEIKNRLLDTSVLLFQKLGCRDYARFDFRADASGEPKLLEVNPNPGWCWDGKMNLMAEMAGRSYPDLLLSILEAAQERVVASLDNRPARSLRRLRSDRAPDFRAQA